MLHRKVGICHDEYFQPGLISKASNTIGARHKVTHVTKQRYLTTWNESALVCTSHSGNFKNN